MKRIHAVVSGRVQGVFFRVVCAERARSAGLAGWVRNRPDGTVEAVFEGDGASVDALVEWCRHGPSGAVVERLELEAEPPAGAEGFRVSG
ncbi:MAG: acylphosphatase [Actinomycetota bacterium]